VANVWVGWLVDLCVFGLVGGWLLCGLVGWLVVWLISVCLGWWVGG